MLEFDRGRRARNKKKENDARDGKKNDESTSSTKRVKVPFSIVDDERIPNGQVGDIAKEEGFNIGESGVTPQTNPAKKKSDGAEPSEKILENRSNKLVLDIEHGKRYAWIKHNKHTTEKIDKTFNKKNR